MNLILKIVQGPNTGAEIALIEGVNVKLGRSDECDIVLTDQTLPDVACELEVGAEKVMLLLPGGGQERLDPLHVKVFETTAIAIGPADDAWGALIWPSPEDETPEEPEPAPEEEPPKEKPRFRTLQLVVLVMLILVVILEFLLWFFWPYVNTHVEKARAYCQAKYEAWTADELELAAQPVHRQTLDDLAKAYQVEAIMPPPHSEKLPKVRGNLRTRAERLKLTASAYLIHPGCIMELTDDESLRKSAEEILYLLTDNQVKVVSAENRQLALAGRLPSVDELKRTLEALNADVHHLEKVDCSQVEILADAVGPVASASKSDSVTESTPKNTLLKNADEAKIVPPVEVSGPKLTAPPRLPLVGVMTVPFPCLVLQDGSRVVEGAEFNGFTIAKISDEFILLKRGDQTLEWRP